MRKDLPEIIRLACPHLKPRIIHIPTNAIASARIRDLTRKSLEIRENVGKKREFAKVTESLRLVYYDLVIRILREQRQVILPVMPAYPTSI